MSALFRSFRFPGLTLAVIAAAALLALASAAGPLFIGAAGGDLFERYSTGDELPPSAVTVTSDSYTSFEIARYRDRLLRQQLEPLTGEAISTRVGEVVSLVAGSRSDLGRLISRDHALEHVRVLSDGGDAGVWLADYSAERLGVAVGDRITMRPSLGTRVRSVPIAGIYRDLLEEPVVPFWAPLFQLIYPDAGEDTRPPVLVFADDETFFELSDAIEDDVTEFRWEFPIPPGRRTLQGARALSSAVYAINDRMADPTSQLGAAFAAATFDSPLASWVAQSEETLTSISGPVRSLSLTGQLVAVAALAGSGVFAVRRRRVEYDLLVARGLSPWRLGLRSTVEILIPTALGGAAGWVLAVWLVRGLGPEGILVSSVLRDTAVVTAGACLAGLLLAGISVASGTRATAAEARGKTGILARRFPWEIIALTLAAASFYEIVTRPDAVTTGADGSARFDVLLLIFPLLFIAGGVGVGVRALFSALPRLRSAGPSTGTAVYLALRRLTYGSSPARSFVTAASIAIGVFVFAGIMSASTEATAEQTASLQVGSDASATVGQRPDLSAAPFPATTVIRLSGATIDTAGGGRVELLGVDRDTFDDTAFWRDEFSASSVTAVMEELAPRRQEEALPLVTSSEDVGSGVVFLASLGVPFEVVGRARALPGMLGDREVALVDLDALIEAFESENRDLPVVSGGFEVWAKDATERELVAYLEAQGASIRRSTSADRLQETPDHVALTWTFDFLESLGVTMAALVLVAGLFFLQSRQRRSEAAYAMARRMGLRRSSYRWSISIELLAMLGAAVTVGGSLAVGAGLLTQGRLELAGLDEIPLLRIPAASLFALGVALCVFAVGAAALVQRKADAADVSQVMRYGG